jgi:hypothetical protein
VEVFLGRRRRFPYAPCRIITSRAGSGVGRTGTPPETLLDLGTTATYHGASIINNISV